VENVGELAVGFIVWKRNMITPIFSYDYLAFDILINFINITDYD